MEALIFSHYDDVIMGAIASQITSLTIVYSTIYSDADHRKHQSSASLAFVWGIPRTNDQLRGKCFHVMTSSWWPNLICYSLLKGIRCARLISTLYFRCTSLQTLHHRWMLKISTAEITTLIPWGHSSGYIIRFLRGGCHQRNISLSVELFSPEVPHKHR